MTEIMQTPEIVKAITSTVQLIAILGFMAFIIHVMTRDI